MTNKLDIKAYVEYLKNSDYNFKQYQRFEKLTITKIDNSGAYPVAICKNQVGKTVKIGVTFLKLYYSQKKDNTFVLKKKEKFIATQAHKKISFVASDGQTFRLEPEDYIVIDSKNKIFAESKENFESNYIQINQKTNDIKEI